LFANSPNKYRDKKKDISNSSSYLLLKIEKLAPTKIISQGHPATYLFRRRLPPRPSTVRSLLQPPPLPDPQFGTTNWHMLGTPILPDLRQHLTPAGCPSPP